ncbi:hypothetical protein T484DRAFT_1930045 [Baffinella frigidus]|nr:hypothetical protein T484DRAFT_1930045 [Cryptophyta sp. CCMP2293]
MLETAAGGGPALTEVIIKGNSQENFHARIGDPDVEALVAVFAQYSFGHVRTIDLSWNDITDKGCQALAGLLRASPKITRLNLAYNSIGEAGITVLSEALIANNKLLFLDVRGNKVGDHGGLEIAKMLCANKSVRSVELGNMDLGHRTLTMLGEALKRNGALTHLNIDRPLLFSAQEEAIEQVAMGLRHNKALLSLSIKQAGIRARGCYLLCDNLALNSTLHTLDLSSNKLPEDAGPSISKLLTLSQSLSTLHLANNQLGDRGCTALSDALATNRTVTDLDVAYNSIAADGLMQLAGAIQQQAGLTKLRVWGNDLQAESTSQLAYACQQCRGLKECDMLVQIVDDTPNAVLKITQESHCYQTGQV